MTDRDEIEKLVRTVFEKYEQTANAHFYNNPEKKERIGYQGLVMDGRKQGAYAVAKDILANFVPRTEHERIVGELEKRLDEDYAIIVALQQKLEKYEPRQPACCG